MKIRVTFKTPDALNSAIHYDELNEEQTDEVIALAAKFFRYGEFVTLELNTESQTVVVLPL